MHVNGKDLYNNNVKFEQYLTWEEYQHMCLNAHEKNTNHIANQVDCLHLNGLHIKWDGHVTKIRLSRIENIWSQLLNMFPESVSEYLKCFLGQKLKFTCTDKDCIMINNKVIEYRKCDISQWNR